MSKPRPEPATDDRGGFLSRWSQRKIQTQRGEPVLPTAPPAAAPVVAAAPAAPAHARSADTPEPAPAPAPPPPTLDDVAALTRDADFTRFVRRDVDGPVRNAALKKLFTDPHYNVMDGLDTYIDDYGRPDPLPASMLRQMAQSKFLGLFTEDDESTPTAVVAVAPPPTPEATAPDEDPDLRLQPDDAAGGQGPEPGPGEDPGREH